MRLAITLALGLLACSGGGNTDTTASGDTAELVPPDVELTDPYTTITPKFDWTEVQVMNGERYKYRYHMPEGASGFVWAFHGNNGNMASVQQTEWIVVYNQLVQRGIGVVLTESLDKQGAWADIDIGRTTFIFDDLVSNGVIDADMPVGAIGFSGGTSMTRMMWEATVDDWNWKAVALHQGGQTVDGMPIFFVGAENDEKGRTRAQYEKRGVLEACRATANDCRLRIGHEVPMDKLRMARLPGITQKRAPDFFDDLVVMQFIDHKGNRRVTFDTPESVDAYMDQYLRLSRMGARAYDAEVQIRVVWATHRFSSEFAQEEANFFWTHLR